MNIFSLKARITVLICILLVIVISTISVFSFVEFREAQFKSLDQTLLSIINGIAATILDNFEDEKQLKSEIDAITSLQKGERVAYRIWAEGSSEPRFASDTPESVFGQLLLKTPNISTNKQKLEKVRTYEISEGSKRFRVAWSKQAVNNEVINIVIAKSSRFANREIAEYVRFITIFSICIVLASSIAIWSLVSWGTKPIYDISSQINNITVQNIGTFSIQAKAIPLEIVPFIDAIKNMLGRLESAIAKQKRFTADASHELRTPLAIAKSTLQSVRMRTRNQHEYEAAIDDTLEEIARLERLIDQLITLARYDEISVLQNRSLIDLGTLLEETAACTKKQHPAWNSIFILENSPSCKVMGDPAELKRLFCCIFDNAVKYSAPGTNINVSIKPRCQTQIAVSIYSQGNPIPSEKLPLIFDRFYRGNDARTSSVPGTGLGLSIALEIAHRHGGKIEIASNQSGTEVTVILPVRN
ncbi:MAG: hypothetical protein A2Y12_16595 [Planctomycetes bacterium GWF2_42_9]|nr:MAG: hypothetical protein A2Y12_16595 [Planctomycetes bacterium GWF2_42_9]